MTPPAPALPDPALIVLVGASGSGKSHWAASRFRAQEVVSSDDLRGIVGSGRHDLDATADAFRLLDDIVAARARRGLTAVVDTLGLDAPRRRSYLALARSHGLPAIAVLFDVPAALARARNAARDRPVPAPALAGQLRRVAAIRAELDDEGWDRIEVVTATESPPVATAEAVTGVVAAPTGLEVVLQVSRFPWGDEPAGWLRSVALAASDAGFAGLALMDHLIQIPQVDRAWSPIPEPWVTLGMLAGVDTSLRLGTLVSPLTFRPAGILAKTAATLDAVSGGRAFLGLGAGWWQREHDGFGLPFPPPRERVDAVAAAIPVIRALWAAGTKAAAGLPETTSYPRPMGTIPIIVGGSGPRTLRVAAALGDACNVPSTQLDALLPAFEQLRAKYGRPSDVTVLDIPVAGRDREEAWSRVEALRGNTRATTYARTHHAGTYVEQRDRYAKLGERGVRTVFVALPHLTSAQDVLDAGELIPR